jgi:dTDP-4-dehydrorhamnose reductase
MRVLVTGATGMLGSSIVERWRGRQEIFATGRSERSPSADWNYRSFDLTALDARPLLDWATPDVIVHCAAWTAVDACESDPERAANVNGRSVERLRLAAPDTLLVYISSEAVFGPRPGPFREDSPVGPASAYGKSKLLGEELLGDSGVIVRTTVVGWNLEPTRQSFIEWIVRTLSRGESITLFEDAVFTPIAATQLADELEHLATTRSRGVWHVTGREATSKHDFGMALATRLGLDTGLIKRGRLDSVRFVAPRSADQRLDVASYEQHFGRRLPSIAETIEALVNDRVTER